jgi:hypothetical protein
MAMPLDLRIAERAGFLKYRAAIEPIANAYHART